MTALLAVAAALAESQVRQTVLAVLLAAILGVAVGFTVYGMTLVVGRARRDWAIGAGCIVFGVVLLLALLL